MRIQNPRLWAGRILVGLVFFFNVQCALAFLVSPDGYAPSFELSGEVGAGVVRAFGILFLMWNVPYAVAMTNPARRRLSLYEASAMQAIGFFGEMALLTTFSPAHAAIRASVMRFIWFDGLGLLALLVAVWLTHRVTVH